VVRQFFYLGIVECVLASCAPKVTPRDRLDNPQYVLNPQTIEAEVVRLRVRYILRDEVLERKHAKGFDYVYENGQCTITLDIVYEALRQAVVLSVGHCLYHQSHSNPEFAIANRAAQAWLSVYYETCGYVLGLPVNDGSCKGIPTLQQAITYYPRHLHS
jgi:hypothetical protein